LVRRTSFEDAACPVARALDAIGDWWSLLIVRDAFDGARRFSEFQKGLGVSKGILAERLRALVTRGVLQMASASDGSAYREYVLTERGRDLFPIVVALRQWGEDHCFGPNEPHSVLVDNDTGQPIARLQVRSTTGRELQAIDTAVRKVVRTALTTSLRPARRRARPLAAIPVKQKKDPRRATKASG
jgi:DNA-binding HxlR family transcriptional regulator